MFTTADLPADMQFTPDNARTRAVRESGLTLAVPCRHAQPCTRCVEDAARRLLAQERETA